MAPVERVVDNSRATEDGYTSRPMPPAVVEIEVGSRCNRRCPYCPVAINPHPDVPRWMSDKVFDTLIGQLGAMSFAGRLSYHLYNEPLLRRDLARLVAAVRVALPDALQILNTNGDLLNDRRYAELRAAGIDWFYVTLHSGGEFPRREYQVVQLGQDLQLTNRGGMLTNLPAPTVSTLSTPCYAPEEMLIVSVTGDVLLCYEDAERTHVMGNVLDEPLERIWRAPAFEAFRQRLRAGDRSVDPMCTRCSNVSHRMPGLSALEDPMLTANGVARSPTALVTLKARSEAGRA